MWRPILAVAVLGLQGCASAPPAIVRVNGPFVTVTQPRHVRQSAVKQVAQDHCAQQGKSATMLSSLCAEATCPEPEVTFECR
mgnify:CR=1 FL=1